MPLTAKGQEIKANMEHKYGSKKGEQVFYASKNKGTITGVDEARGRLADSIKSMCDACGIDDGARPDAIAGKKPEHEITIKFNGDFNMAALIKHLHRLGQIGASRTVIALDENDKEVKFGWDGDGADKIMSCTMDGVNILK